MRVSLPALIACDVLGFQLRHRLYFVVLTINTTWITTYVFQLACDDEQLGFMDATKDYIAGLAAGVATVLIGHPFDTLKVTKEAGEIFFNVWRISLSRQH